MHHKLKLQNVTAYLIFQVTRKTEYLNSSTEVVSRKSLTLKNYWRNFINLLTWMGQMSCLKLHWKDL